jgi:glycine cleavage system H protein
MASQIKENLKYTKEHEWALIEGDVATVGITDFAQSALGDIVFVEVPEKGKNLKQGDIFGVVESIKSVSDLYSPLTGVVIERNESVEGSPEKLNTDPYGSWLIKIKLSQPQESQSLLSPQDYNSFCQSQG